MNRDAYLERMRDSRQFRYFCLTPVWRPGEGDIDGFVHDEVVRQFHDPRVRDDGGIRVEWMREAWDYAKELRAAGAMTPKLIDVRDIGRLVEPVNRSGFRTGNVYIGDRMGAPPMELSFFMQALVDQARHVKRGPADTVFFKSYTKENFVGAVDRIETVDDWYLAYERIHRSPTATGALARFSTTG